jgi:hypothetical protein
VWRTNEAVTHNNEEPLLAAVSKTILCIFPNLPQDQASCESLKAGTLPLGSSGLLSPQDIIRLDALDALDRLETNILIIVIKAESGCRELNSFCLGFRRSSSTFLPDDGQTWLTLPHLPLRT